MGEPGHGLYKKLPPLHLSGEHFQCSLEAVFSGSYTSPESSLFFFWALDWGLLLTSHFPTAATPLCSVEGSRYQKGFYLGAWSWRVHLTDLNWLLLKVIIPNIPEQLVSTILSCECSESLENKNNSLTKYLLFQIERFWGVPHGNSFRFTPERSKRRPSTSK